MILLRLIIDDLSWLHLCTKMEYEQAHVSCYHLSAVEAVTPGGGSI